ncbi:uncharacterized protein LOC129356033, partial [Poeciliopsis prolifica]|uniref:uncharacterized protein LOC129356033 n=1 Tax=Poeciliopsis prolifica TaxID=188132 RepID=UPI002413E98E
MCRYACDIRVVVLMRERSRGNSVTQLNHKLTEEHRNISQPVSPLLTRPSSSRHCSPASAASPQTQVAAVRVRQDVLSRLPEVRAKITSVFGSVLKMDSTKKVTKKLAGAAANTAGCWTNVSNEHGQVLASVLAAAEGRGLWPMAAGLVRRYREAGAAPPSVMYVDRDRCSPQARGQAQVAAMFRHLALYASVCSRRHHGGSPALRHLHGAAGQ